MINTKRRKMMTSQKVDTTGSLGSAQKVAEGNRGGGERSCNCCIHTNANEFRLKFHLKRRSTTRKVDYFSWKIECNYDSFMLTEIC